MPCYLAYKSLRTGDPAQTTPWLIYFIMLTLALLAESWTLFVIGWMPFYSWFRLFFLLYMVLPQTQGAKFLYLTYFEPFILHHEHQIDAFIGQTHARLEQMGLGYMNIVVEWLREKVLGQSSPQAHAATSVPPGAQGYATYAADLLSRFAMPQARTNAAPAVSGAGGMLGMLSSAAGAAMSNQSTSRSMPAATQAAGIPDSLLSGIGAMSSDQKSSYIVSQRDRLTNMLKALDKEQQTLDLAYGDAKGTGRRTPSSQGGEFTKSRSQMSFDNIDYDDVHSSSGSGYPSQHSTPPTMRQSSGQKRTTSGNWVTGNLGGWLGGSPRDERTEHDHREERRSPRVSGGAAHPDDEDYASRGWSTARDITDSIARSGRDRDTRDRDYR